MSRRKTIKEWQEESDKIHNKEFILIQEPKNAHDKIKIKHIKCDNILYSTPRNHIKNYCKYCTGKHKRTLKEWQEESDKIHNKEFKILKLGKNNKSNSDINHLKCGKNFQQSMNNHINHGNKCPYCSNKIYKIEDLQNRSDKIHNYEFEIKKLPKNFKDPIPIKHLKCDNINIQSMNNHILHEKGCYICNFNRSKNIQELQNLSNKIHKNKYIILETPNNYNDKVEIKHITCGKIYEQSMRCHITQGCGCNIYSESKGEKIISETLDELNILYKREFIFNECKYKNKLKFDFYIPLYNTCIEYDGIQHFEVVEFFGGEKILKENKIRDNIKNRFCFDNKINLVRLNL